MIRSAGVRASCPVEEVSRVSGGRPHCCGVQAFSLVELLLVISILSLLAGLLLPSLARAKARARIVQCASNLKQVGLALHVWSDDHDGRFPWQVAVTEGGSYGRMNAWQHFLVASNELDSPRLLACPTDGRKPASHWGRSPGGFAWPGTGENNALSVFVGLDARSTRPASLLSGDRNIANGTPNSRCGTMPTNFAGAYALDTAVAAAVVWKNDLHSRRGNLLLVDGSIAQLQTDGLRQAVRNADDARNDYHTLPPY